MGDKRRVTDNRERETKMTMLEQLSTVEKSGRHGFNRDDVRMALIVTRREVRDSFRDWRIIIPILLLTLFFPALMNFTAGRMLGFVGQFGAELIAERLVPFLLLVVGFFPMSFSLVIALETFVGEKERKSLEPLLATPLTNVQLYVGKMMAAVIPPLLASYIGITVYLVGLAVTARWYAPRTLLVQALLITTVQGVVMVAGAEDRPLVGLVGRLVEQKGLELILPVLESFLELPVQLAILGTGEPRYEQRLQAVAAAHPDAMAVVLAYDESLAHRIEAAADIFLMPSLFEPCGLNQLYSLRYGTLPLVRAVGGLADTVVDTNAQSVADGSATGFVFRRPDAGELLAAMQRAAALWYDKQSWRQVQLTAMRQDFSWQQSANRYLQLYNDTA